MADYESRLASGIQITGHSGMVMLVDAGDGLGHRRPQASGLRPQASGGGGQRVSEVPRLTMQDLKVQNP